uniref:Nudix hydrolase domain-containing protein n=1 Tax=Panagrellus redivivus TaxID=6233 RepID=A0A7E4UQM9_PANRE
MASQAEDKPILEAASRRDHFRGITIDLGALELPATEAETALQVGLSKWIAENVHGVWFKVPTKQSFWIPILIAHDFDYHHAQPGYVMLTRWLPTHKSNSLPRYPFTTIGVGGVVVNEKGQFLLVREKRGIYLGWKFPGGMADPGEDVYTTAIREVSEETGVKTRFETVFTMRHLTNFRAYPNCGDMYFLCALKPADENQIEPKHCQREIAACQWMSKSEIDALSSTEFHPFNKSILEAYLNWKASGRQGFHASKMEIPELHRTFTVYNID